MPEAATQENRWKGSYMCVAVFEALQMAVALGVLQIFGSFAILYRHKGDADKYFFRKLDRFEVIFKLA